ncbi:MAG: 50S ribosomal protein L13 [Thermoplasmata archaeon]|nr:MAG: 50S ribosomal protein L13 [Thermoplasmata archaeon]HDO69283.1 50S ribosomal protein L13 [Thermoplasmatales archaeon]HEX17198.1 50S ribosomal protein L13 [Thermoplasmatales archaeon]
MVKVIDADGAVLGRMASIVAKRLLKGEEIAIVNSEKAIIVGDEQMIKQEYREKREIGTQRKGPFFPRMPHMIVKRTIRGMLPYQQPKGREALKRLRCYIGVPEEYANVEKEKVGLPKKKPYKYITIAELSRYLGAKV